MKVLAVVLIIANILTHCDAKKESVETELTKQDAELLFKLIKRIGNTDYNYPSEDSDQSAHDSYGKQSASRPSDRQQTTCLPTIKQGFIIKATESINKGADYIASIKGVASNTDCIDHCCRNSSCDVAVYQDKKDHYCYLFRCEDKCEFKEFGGYYVTNLHHRPGEESEQDLQSLNSDLSGNSPPTDSQAPAQEGGHSYPEEDAAGAQNQDPQVPPDQIEETTPRKPAPTPTDAPEPVIAPHSVGLRGFCRQDGHCEDPNAACVQGNCMCQERYYDKEGVCRKVCPPSNFECFELGTLSRGPECVPREQVCDSYMQCADGSDEFNCENIAPKPNQKNWSEQKKPDWSNSGANNQVHGDTDPYTAPVAQQPASTNQQALSGQDGDNSYSSGLGPGNHGNSGLTAARPRPNVPAQQSSDVRPTPGAPHGAPASMESSMRLNQSPSHNNAPPARTNPNHSDYGGIPQLASDPNTNPSHSQPTNPNYVPTNKNLVNTHGSSEPIKPPARSNQQYANSQSGNLPPQHGQTNSGPPSSYQGPSQSFHGQPQNAQHPSMPRQGQASKIPSSGPNPAYSEGGAYKKYPAQAQGRPVMDTQQQKVYPGGSGGGQAASRQGPQSGPNKSGSDPRQDGKHYGQESPSSPKLNPASSPRLSSPSKSTGSQSSRAKSSSSQSSSKSYSSSLDPTESQNRQQLPSYSNSQKWLDPSLYMPYGLGDSSSQQGQPQQPMGSRYYDSSQYYPRYPSDNLDSLPESLLGNSGSADDFSQFGNPYLTQDKPYGSSYQAGRPNSGFLGYPETPYGSQYPSGNRYDYNGEYRPSGYQEQDFYPSLGSQQGYRPSAGLYEDFPSHVGQHKPSSLSKPQGGHSAGSVSGPDTEHKSGSWSDKDKDKDGQASVVQSTPRPSQTPPKTTTAKTKASNGTAPKTERPSPVTTKAPSGKQGSSKHVFMSREKVIIASSTSNAEGPIIALSLGLAFTLILIVLLGCRLRNMRHRLRKGRPLHQNEADYLINGMYL